MTYVVTTPSFHGPLDVLVQIVGRHEIDLLDLPLAPVVDEFVAHLVDPATSLDPNEVSEFLLLAAILVELKSRQLLPVPEEQDLDDELVGWEERDVLLARLLELRTYAAAADHLVALIESADRSVRRQRGLDDGFVAEPPDLLAGVRPADLARAFLRALAEKPTALVALDHVTVDAVSVAETVAILAQQLPAMGRASFRELTRGLGTRIELIVHFLALLELCKLGLVDLGQGRTFGDLEIAWTGASRDVDWGRIDIYEG